MSYLKFDRTLMINLSESLTREVLRTNRKGAYHCTSIVDCNTRKYHGLLVMPVNNLGKDNHVLLSSLDETVIQHGAEFNLGLHKYAGENYSPKGHKYIREFNCDIVPRTIYRVGGVILAKEKIFSLFENRILIKYTLLEAHSPTTLRFRPFLAFRSVKTLSYANDYVNKSIEPVENGIKTCMYEGYPDLYMQFSKKANFVFTPDWYYGVEYPKEQERGYPYQEDLYVPGYFEVPIKKGESVIFSAGDEVAKPRRLRFMFDSEAHNRTPRSNFFNCLKNAAQQFYFRLKETDAYILAGYPWFGVRARDLFVSLPGCTLCLDDSMRYHKIMAAAIPALRNFMETGDMDPVIEEIDDPDVLLWAIWAIQQYAKNQGWEKCIQLYGDFVEEAIRYIREQKHPLMREQDNGLLYVRAENRACTWMNSTVNGTPVVKRCGCIVEINALWYNALGFYKDLLIHRDGADTSVIEGLMDIVKASFKSTFINQYGYLFDSVDGNIVDWSVRPNMVFAIALDYSPLNRHEKRTVLDYITKELLTPKGLRSLSPKSEGYNPYYVGAQVERDLAYHQGTAWPWLYGFYLEAYINVFGQSGVSFVERMLIGLEEEMQLHCVGTLSEVFDGNPPFAGRGAISFAMNVASILRVLDYLKKCNLE